MQMMPMQSVKLKLSGKHVATLNCSTNARINDFFLLIIRFRARGSAHTGEYFLHSVYESIQYEDSTVA
jgi:hypothetical protein